MAYAPLLGWTTWGLAALAAGLFVGGMALLILGRRGRRIDDHPVCRHCRFDLTGTEMPEDQPPKCPECGWRRVPRVGNRRRRPGLAWLGLACVFLGLSGGGLLVFGAWDATRLASMKPVWLLRWESRAETFDTAAVALEELIRRQRDGNLSVEVSEQLIADAVAHGPAADPSLVEHRTGSRWDELAAELISAGIGNQGQHQAIGRSWADTSMRLRSKMYRGSEVPLYLRQKIYGPPRSLGFIARFGPTRVRFGDSESLVVPGISDHVLWDSRGWNTETGMTIQLRPDRDLPGGLPLGNYQLTAECPISIVYASTGQIVAEWNHQQQLDFEYVGPEDDPIRMIHDPDAGLALERNAKLSVRKIEALPTGSKATLEIDQVTAPIAYRVFIRQGNRRWVYDQFASPPLTTSGLDYRLDGPVPDVLPAGAIVDLEFIPDPVVARGTVDLTAILDHRFVISGVEIVRYPGLP